MSNEFTHFEKIDMHSHIGAVGEPFNINQDAEKMLEVMKEYNISKSLICSVSDDLNLTVKAAAEKYPQQLIPIARINCSKGKPAYDMLEHLIRNCGFKGGKIQSLFDGYAADSSCVDPAAEILEQYGLPFFVHSGHAPFSLPWQIGLLAERPPRLKICMLHMGHGNGIYVAAALEMARRYKNIWLETSGTSMTAQIENAYKTVDPQRIMFGLDLPFHAPSVEIQKTMACQLPDEAKADIFCNNAKKFMDSLLD